ncbi:hypothetical protein [Streptomyces sp. NPDC048277]|uniref:hypothetical protein n=1 Tax=Streptomyces sp. NPDC048277 TaxID=3155027 RepID=UPI0033F91685
MSAITDAEFDRAAALDPSDVLRYLRGRGWVAAENFGRGQLWVLPVPDDDPEPPYEVTVPLARQLRDYPARVADVLETLSAVEARRPGDVLREMTLPSADWQYLRLTPPGPSGTAPLVDLVPALAGLRDLLVSAAATAAAPEPQPVQPAQKPQRVKDYISSVRLDQTRVGSYVIAAHTPLSAPPITQLSLDGPPSGPEPFERLVSRRLYAGVKLAQRAALTAVRDDSLSDFDLFTLHGLSANLCEALVRIGGEEGRGYSFKFDWSPDLPLEGSTPPIELPTRLLPVLAEGAKDLRARLGQRNVYVRGTVVRLHRELPEGPGEVTVSGYVEDERRPRRLRMVLDQEAYSRAAFAHDQGFEVGVKGDLVMRGNAARLEPVSTFTVIHSPE